MLTTGARRMGRAGALAARPRRRPLRPRRATEPRGAFLLADFNQLGFNYRMTDIQGALGCAQMDRADWILDERRRRAAALRRGAGRRRLAAHARDPRGQRPRLPVLLLPVRARGADASRPAPAPARAAQPRDAAHGGAGHRHPAGDARAGPDQPVLATATTSRDEDFPSAADRRAPVARPAAVSRHDRRRAGARGLESCCAPSRRASVCGIAGVLDRSGRPVERELLQRMGDVIAHRGPDGEGQYADGPVGLVNRRLAIIDPVAGGRHADGLARRALLHHLQRRGLQLPRAARRARAPPATASARTPTPRSSSTPTRPGARRASSASTACSRSRSGTARRAELFLARDRFGVKPLYYADLGRVFLFGSEIKSMLEHDALRARLSPPHLLEYFTFQNIFTDGTLFDDVRLLRPGHHLTDAPRPRRPRARASTGTSTSASPRTAGARRGSTRRSSTGSSARPSARQLVSDVPVGAHLSGGMDSGSITALAAEALPYLNTFTVGFDMTSRMGTRGRQPTSASRPRRCPTSSAPSTTRSCSSRATWSAACRRWCGTSRTRASARAIPTYYGARLASKFVKVALSGSGGDELFAGYPWRYYRAVVNDDFDHYIEKYYGFWHRLVPNSDPAPSSSRRRSGDEVASLRTIDIFRDQFPDTSRPAAPRTTSTTRSTSRRRPSCPGCSSSRTS